jgi:hypothetical protein
LDKSEAQQRHEGPIVLPGQTLMFLGDHTSPDAEGYVRVVRDVVARFHPALRPTLISTGSSEQTARALNSDVLQNLLVSSHPDWLIIGIGLADAFREPLLPPLVEQWQLARASTSAEVTTFGQERSGNGSGHNSSPVASNTLSRLSPFKSNLGEAVMKMAAGGLRPVLLTTILVGDDLSYPLNAMLRHYNKAIRSVAEENAALLVDIERACNDLFTRAGQYKQKVALAGYRGDISPQGEALLARTLLQALGLLPYPGYRARK